LLSQGLWQIVYQFRIGKDLLRSGVLGENCGTKKSLAGIYVLIIQVGEDISVDVGALGETVFEKGLYAYVGSAQANLEQRVKRHLRREKKKFWHIDYLLDNSASKIIKVFYREAGKTEECETARIIGENSEPIAGFGCSDCHCKSHLFHIKNYAFIQETMKLFPTET
jgi:Uri superfamily endonuclease